MITRRDFVTAAAAAAAMAGGAGVPLRRLAAEGRITEDQLTAFRPIGNVTLVHMTDLHAQLMPLYFREPSLNIGVGDVKGRIPHLAGAAMRTMYRIPDKSPEAYALSSDDFVELARLYGRMGGLDRIATILKAIRAERDGKVLFLDGGDTWTNSWTALRTRGQDMVETMALLKPDAMTGHWEFTLGEARVKELVAGLGFPFLAQNVREGEFDDIVFERSAFFERGGVRIAVIGQAFPFTPIAHPRWMIPGWRFGLRLASVQREVDEARAGGADLVILLSHNGFDVDRKLAGMIRGIDVILSGHTHDALPEPVQAGDTLIVASGSNGKFLSRLDLIVENKTIKGYGYRLIPIFSDAIRPDPEVAAAIARHRAPFEAELTRVVGHAETLLYRRGSFDGTLDHVICEAMLAERDAEIALSPGIRWGTTVLPDSEITFEDITNGTALTYPACYRTTMTGARLKDVLEDVADNIFNPDPFFQQGGDMVRAGGIGYTIDVSQPIGRRISSLTLLRTGEAIEPGRQYTLAGWASVNEGTEGPAIWDVIASYIAARKVISVKALDTVKVIGA